MFGQTRRGRRAGGREKNKGKGERKENREREGSKKKGKQALETDVHLHIMRRHGRDRIFEERPHGRRTRPWPSVAKKPARSAGKKLSPLKETPNPLCNPPSNNPHRHSEDISSPFLEFYFISPFVTGGRRGGERGEVWNKDYRKQL